MVGAMIAPARLSREAKVEYVNFLLIVGRMNLPHYWCGFPDGNVLVHSMQRVIAPGYTNFKVVFQENVSTGHRQVTSCSAQELLEDKRFSHVYFPVFVQLSRSEKLQDIIRDNVFGLIVSCLTPEKPTAKHLPYSSCGEA